LKQAEHLPFKIIEAEADGIFAAGIAYRDETGRGQFISSVRQALKVESAGTELDGQAVERSWSQLENYCRAEARSIHKTENIEKNNQLQAKAQVALNNQVVRSLLSSKLKNSKLDDVAPVLLKALEEQFNNRDTALRVSNVPKELENVLKAGLIPPKFPTQGDGHVDTPLQVVRTALDSLARRIDGSRTPPKKQTASGIVEAINKMPFDSN
jgi:hypothetical protein